MTYIVMARYGAELNRRGFDMYIVMAYTVMAYVVMAYMVMAYIVMAPHSYGPI